ncbi:MAG: GerMN domain-containing protein [Firmicutes bacterium]|jgi:spore germination protein GerM|nr:GerMN domain-containing protein [Bacillota bacterium]
MKHVVFGKGKKNLLILLILAVTLSSCGVPLSSQPNPIPLKQIPYGLETESKETVPTPKTPIGKKGPTGLTFYVYFVDNGLLTPVTRTAPDPTPELALKELALGPTFTEQENNITTALQLNPQPKLTLQISKGANPIATVSLDTTTASSPAIYLYQELGQIVWTLTQFCNVTGVQFTYGGTPFPAYLPNGTDPTDPVNRIDYLEIVPTQLAVNIRHFSCIGPVNTLKVAAKKS